MKGIEAFEIGHLPKILFGPGRVLELPELALTWGRRVLLVTGRQSLFLTPSWANLERALHRHELILAQTSIAEEPSPETIDRLVAEFRPFAADVVIGIGGGSVLDAAKAIAGLLRVNHHVMDFLEGVGPELCYPGPEVPFIAVPTTAGTGSEATRNAVLTRTGDQGFKKSFRHERLVARWALIDPDLLAGCPKDLIAANGMDALTQLLEAFVSLRANPLTDALAISGLQSVQRGLLAWYACAENAEARGQMAYAALLSGICLAQTGLGSVHGLAQPLGSLHALAHGVACGSLLSAATKINLKAIRARNPRSPALEKYRIAGRILSDDETLGDEAALESLVEKLEFYRRTLKLPTLGALGVNPSHFEKIVPQSRNSSMNTNPIHLEDDEISEILRLCL